MKLCIETKITKVYNNNLAIDYHKLVLNCLYIFCSLKQSPPVLRSILKSPRPKSSLSNEDVDGEAILSEEDIYPKSNSTYPSPRAAPAPPARRKSLFGSLFGSDLGPVDTSFVHTATEVALDFLYPMRKIDKR